MKKKITLIDLVAQRHPQNSRKELFAQILCGEMRINGETVRDPQLRVDINAEIYFVKKAFVSRGGKKLDFALNQWMIDVKGKIFLDSGSSTGGFTDCLLKKGALFVHAVDVGYNQLTYSLRNDDRISVHERTNIMSVNAFYPEPDAAVADLSFRSVTGAASHLLSIVKEQWMIAVIKPQFELVNPEDSFNGIIRSDDQLFNVTRTVINKLWNEKAYVSKVLNSPIKGRKGNREFLFLIRSMETEKKENITDLVHSCIFNSK